VRIYQTLKEEAWEANMELPKRGLVIYTFGNVSAMDRERGVFAIKPSGVPYDALKPEDMVIVGLEGEVIEGVKNPSSDTRTHAVLYRHFKEIGGIAHTHSTYATAWAQAARPIPIYGTTHADHCAVDIPCTRFMTNAAIKGDYEEATGDQIVQTFKSLNPAEVKMVLVAGHGPFTWGRNAAGAVYHAAILEELANMARLSEQINPELSRLKSSLVRKHYDRKHGPNATYGQK